MASQFDYQNSHFYEKSDGPDEHIEEIFAHRFVQQKIIIKIPPQKTIKFWRPYSLRRGHSK